MPFERWFYAWRVRLRMLIDRDRVDRDLDDELRHHVALETEARTAQGIPAAEARRQALATFGGLESARNGVHEVRFGAALEQIVQDLKYALRSLSRSRGFALVGVVTVALGIGASTAVFSVVDAVLLNPLPFSRAERIVTVWQFDATAAVERGVSPGNFLEWRDRSNAFDRIAAVEPSGVDLVSEGEPQNLRIWRVSEGFFDILGVPAQHGRTFTADEHQPGADGAVVLSQGFWQQRFGGDPSVVGRTLTLSERPYVVVGVMPQQFDYPPGRDLWMSRAFTEDDRQNRGGLFLNVIARLTPGVSVDAARAEMRGVAEQLAREYPTTNQRFGASIIPLRDRVVGDARPYLLLLSGAVAFVLLITCVNVANLLLARGTARTQEFAVRAALGAGRWRLCAQLFVESLVLAVLGGVLGVVAARWGLLALVSLAPGDIPRLQEAGVDPTALAFAATLSCLTAFLVGILPARLFSRVNGDAALVRASRGGRAIVNDRTRRLLVIGEVALALVLLTGASLLARSFVNLLRVDPGFSQEGVVALPVFVWRAYPEAPRRAMFFEETLRRVSAAPGVTSAAAASIIPFGEIVTDPRTRLTIDGRPTEDDARPTIGLNVVTPDYFRTMGIAVVEGRVFSPLDLADTTPVAIINETTARRFWPNDRPLAARIKLTDGPDVVREIIGIVRDTRDTALDDTPVPMVFLPHQQHPTGTMTYVVKASGAPGSIVSAVKAAVWTVNPELPFRPVTTLQRLVDSSIAPRQFVLVLMSVFGVVGLFLASVGMFGLIKYLVERRTRELGLRMALGAAPDRLVWALIGEGLRLAATGVLIGVVGALGLTRLLSTLLFGIPPTDPASFVGAIVVVLSVAGLASYLPARKIVAASPMLALQSQ